MRCRWDLRLSSAQPTGCSPPSSGTPCRSAAPARARPSSGFVGSWRTAGKLPAPANGFLRFRWSIDLTRGIHRKEPGSFHEDDIVEERQNLSRYIGQIGPLGHDLMQTECDGVRIMTMTSSKGLTVEATIIAGTEDGVIPRPDADLSEERRLMYVAMTRPRKYLYCTWAQRRHGPTARAGDPRVRALRQVSHFLAGGPVRSHDGSRFIRERFR